MRNNPNESLKAVQSVDPQELTSTANGTGVDCKGFDDALFVFNIGTLSGTSPTLDIKVQTSDDDGSSDAYADLTDATVDEITTSNDATVYVGRVKCDETERYLRPVLTIGGTSPVVPASVTVVLSNAKYPPTSQVETEAFNVPAITG